MPRVSVFEWTANDNQDEEILIDLRLTRRYPVVCKTCKKQFRVVEKPYLRNRCVCNLPEPKHIPEPALRTFRYKDPGFVSTRTRFRVLNKFKFTCQYCGRKAPDVVLHVDHIIPRSLGGTAQEDNLTVACSECNLGKSNLLLAA